MLTVFSLFSSDSAGFIRFSLVAFTLCISEVSRLFPLAGGIGKESLARKERNRAHVWVGQLKGIVRTVVEYCRATCSKGERRHRAEDTVENAVCDSNQDVTSKAWPEMKRRSLRCDAMQMCRLNIECFFMFRVCIWRNVRNKLRSLQTSMQARSPFSSTRTHSILKKEEE